MGKDRFTILLGSMAAIASVLLFAVSAEPVRSAPGFEGSVLAAHNRERARLGLSGLNWNARLANEAGQWARTLAAEGQLRHSSHQEREDTGENLWMGTTGRFSTEKIIGAFVDERSLFVPGRFPNVSRSGNWQDVGHYTQLIWPDTREVGCAMAQGRGYDVLVCRYWPAGNWVGETVG